MADAPYATPDASATRWSTPGILRLTARRRASTAAPGDFETVAARRRGHVMPQAGRRRRRLEPRALPAGDAARRSSSRPTTCARSPTWSARSTSSHGDDKRARARCCAVLGGRRRLDRARSTPAEVVLSSGGLPPALRHAVHRRRSPPTGRARGVQRLLLPPRAEPRPGAHADLPHARVRPRRHARAARWRTATTWLERGLAAAAPTSASPVDVGGGQRPVLRPAGRCSPRNQRDATLKFEAGRSRSARSRSPTAIASGELPRRPLRRAVRHRDRRRREPRRTRRARRSAWSASALALLATPRSRPASEWPRRRPRPAVAVSRDAAADLDPANYAPHALHAARPALDRDQLLRPTSWIEAAARVGPRARSPGCGLHAEPRDFDGDQWTDVQVPARGPLRRRTASRSTR